MQLEILHGRETAIEKETFNLGNLTVVEPTVKSLKGILEKAHAIRRRLMEIPISRRLEILGLIGKKWHEKVRRGELDHVRRKLSEKTGYSEKLIDLEFKFVSILFNNDNILSNIEVGLPGGVKAIDSFIEFRPGEYVRHVPIGTVFIIGAGNSFIPPLIPTCISLAMGNVTILKPSIANHLGVIEVYRLLLDLADEYPEAEVLSNAILIAYMRHNSEALRYLLEEAPVDLVNFWGGEPARTIIAEKVARNPHKPKFMVNGPLTGYAVVGSGVDLDKAADDLALNIVLYDQQLCSSPTEAAFIGSYEELIEFASKVGLRLNGYSEKFPLKLDDSERYLVHSVRRALTFEECEVFTPENGDISWTIVVSKDKPVLDKVIEFFPEYQLHVRKRFIEIVSVDTVDQAIKLIENIPHRETFKEVDGVQTVGYALPEKDAEAFISNLCKLRVYRIVPLRDMYMRSAIEPFDGMYLARELTYSIYLRRREVGVI